MAACVTSILSARSRKAAHARKLDSLGGRASFGCEEGDTGLNLKLAGFKQCNFLWAGV